MPGGTTMSELTYLGYPRPGGASGVRNHLLVLSVTGLTGPTARHIQAQLRPSIVYSNPHGSGHLGTDADVQKRCMQAFATHPNVGAVLIIGADSMKIDPVVEAARHAGRPHEALCLDDFEHDALSLRDAALRAGAALLKQLSRERRESMELGTLRLGLECGRSDPSSGLVANPLVGLIADRVVDAGGTVMIGETTEWLGAEDRLTSRAARPDLADAIIEAASARETMARQAGLSLTYNNPSLTNIQAGLTTIEEKSLGAVAKSGSRQVRGLLSYGEAPSDAGCWVMDAPAYAPESVTGFAAASCNMALFTTGVGNSYTSALMPTIKLTGNPVTAKRLAQQIDFEASSVFEGRETLDNAAARFLEQLVATASGELTWGEIFGDADETVSRFGASL